MSKRFQLRLSILILFLLLNLLFTQIFRFKSDTFSNSRDFIYNIGVDELLKFIQKFLTYISLLINCVLSFLDDLMWHHHFFRFNFLSVFGSFFYNCEQSLQTNRLMVVVHIHRV